MIENSSITFGELAENLSFIKVIWNGQTVYDDDNDFYDIFKLNEFYKCVKNKIVYSMNIIITQWHHCILVVQGEDITPTWIIE